jgi:hypothetical protein
VFSFKLIEKLSPALLSNSVNTLIRNEKEEVRDYANRKMNEIKGLSVSERYVLSVNEGGGNTSRNVLSKADIEMVIRSGGEITKARIQKLTRSADTQDRQYAAELLLNSSGEGNISFLIELLSDSEPIVRMTAIKTAVKKNNSEVIFALIENLANPLFGNQCMNALVLIGGKALSLLDSAFYRSGQSTQTLLRIVQAMGRIGGQRAKDLLWNKIEYPDKAVVSQVLLSLGECGFKAGISQITRIKYAIEMDIENISWNLGAIQELQGDSSLVTDALRSEIQNDIEHIYMLLAMLYDARSIQLVKENIESGTAEGTMYAIELLDVFLSEQLKVRVIPVLDDISDAERINRLDIFYPRVKLDDKLVLKFLVNRDFAQSNRWTKATVLNQIGLMQISDFKLDLIAQLFNPDPLIHEVAAWALAKIDVEEYRLNVARLGEDVRKRLDKVIFSGEEHIRQFDKIRFLQSIEVFNGIDGITLSYLADIADEETLDPGTTIVLDASQNNNFYLIVAGKLLCYSQGLFFRAYGRGEFVGEMISQPGFESSYRLQATNKVTILKINKDHFYELISDHITLVDRILDFV